MNYPLFVKNNLTSIINEMSNSLDQFVKKPGQDFTRNRKLSFETMMNLLLSMGGNCVYKELLDYFEYDVETASSSAFIQQRSKINLYAFKYLLDKFTGSFDNLKTFKDYRLLAIDGTDLNIANNPKDVDSHFLSTPERKGYNLIHLNAMYDLCNKLFVDACIQSRRKSDERKALIEMVEGSKIKGDVLIVADRGYESYNVFSHIEQKGWKYVIRVKDVNSNGILSSLKLPDTDEFDVTVNLTLTRKNTKETGAHPEVYKIMPSSQKFDYFELKNTEFFPIKFRAVRFKISDDSYQTIITNVETSKLSLMDIKQVYRMRWGIETSFRELKYAIGLTNFHSKKVEYIIQEVYARLVMYNFCELITLHVIIQQKPTKHGYQANFTLAIQICKHFFRCNDSPPNVEALIKKNVLPIRNDRNGKRKTKPKGLVSFNYRIA